MGSPEVGVAWTYPSADGSGDPSVDGLVRGSRLAREFQRAEPWAEDYRRTHVTDLDPPGVFGFMKAKRRKTAEECLETHALPADYPACMFRLQTQAGPLTSRRQLR